MALCAVGNWLICIYKKRNGSFVSEFPNSATFTMLLGIGVIIGYFIFGSLCRGLVSEIAQGIHNEQFHQALLDELSNVW